MRLRPDNFPAVRSAALLLAFAGPFWAFGQEGTGATPGAFVISEELSLQMSRSQVMASAQDAWAVSFGQEPGGRLTMVDAENGLLEGVARMNYRSKLLLGREETMGSVAYKVTVQARNGQCQVRIHDLRHSGNRNAKGGGVSAGLIMEGVAPEEHYEGMGLGMSRRVHADIREAAGTRLREALRRFTARMRLLGGE